MTERTVVITRIFDAPPELVFEAWTDPVHLAAWFGPKGFTNPVCEVDLRIGGKLRIVMRAPDGAQHPMIGIFREIVRPERLVFTNIATDLAGKVLLEGLTTVTFAEHGTGQTKLTMESHAEARVDYASPMLEGMEAGWTQTIDRLGEYVATVRRTRLKSEGEPMQIEPYLFLDGRCEEAIEFYRRALGAEVEMLMRWKDCPEPPKDKSMTPPGGENKVMHAQFRVGGTKVMASDGRCTGEPSFQGFALSLSAANEAEADRLFNALADGGQIQMPIGKTFFSPRFGMVADRFGVPWMVVVLK